MMVRIVEFLIIKARILLISEVCERKLEFYDQFDSQILNKDKNKFKI